MFREDKKEGMMNNGSDNNSGKKNILRKPTVKC